MTGRRLASRYELQEAIAIREAYEVWRGTDERTGACVAVRLSAPGQPRGDLSLRWSAEAEASRAFAHRLLVPAIETGTDADVHWVVWEFAEGRSLEEMLASGPLSPEVAEHIAAELCRLLADARRADFEHRGITPRHVTFDPYGGLHVYDLLTGGHDGPIAFESQWFLAPEQQTATVRTEQEDVYNVGALLKAACTATPPNGGEIGDRGTPREVEPFADLLTVAQRAVAVAPSDRYQTLADMLDALRARREARQVGRHLRPVVGLAAIGVALAVLAGSFANTRVTVPSVVGMPPARAAEALHHAGLSPLPEAARAAKQGRVVAQMPSAGARVAPLSTVRLHLSRTGR